MMSHMLMPIWFSAMTLAVWLGGPSGCIHEVSTVASVEVPSTVLIVGRAMSVISGDRGRRFKPEVRQMELMQRQTGRRYRVMIEEEDKVFAFFLPAGAYDVTRVQIHEGPFLSIAQLSSTFTVGHNPVAYVGDWRFGVDSPRYGRMVLVSMVDENATRLQAERTIREQYPALATTPLATVIPSPAETATRLYEVSPYPRVQKYFQRHNW